MIYLREIEAGGVHDMVVVDEADRIARGSVILKFDRNGRLIGIEVLNASRALPKEFLAAAERLGPPIRLSDVPDA